MCKIADSKKFFKILTFSHHLGHCSSSGTGGKQLPITKSEEGRERGIKADVEN